MKQVRIRVVEEEGEFHIRERQFPKHCRSKSFYPANPREGDYEFFCDLLSRLGFRPSKQDVK